MAGESPASILFDENGNPVLVNFDGARQLAVLDEEVLGVLKQILGELEKLNAVMAYATDLEFDPGDLE